MRVLPGSEPQHPGLTGLIRMCEQNPGASILMQLAVRLSYPPELLLPSSILKLREHVGPSAFLLTRLPLAKRRRGESGRGPTRARRAVKFCVEDANTNVEARICYSSDSAEPRGTFSMRYLGTLTPLRKL
ncbi:hypothetical protein FS749_007747 [Ceratobasidium sp. UAMH 11750]|nr:hypothetical protein FS749_007747 [Ceratobasidium sp. UAMH 11750]